MTMDCDQVRTMLAGYADGELSAVEREAVELHLGRCGRCRATVAGQRHVRRVLESYAPPAVAPERWSAMRRHLEAELDGREETRLVTRPRAEPFDAEDEEPFEPGAAAPGQARSAVAHALAGNVTRRFRGGLEKRFLPRAARRRPRWRWVAHAAGVLAAAALVAGAFWTARQATEFEVGPDALATQADVTIHSIQMLDPQYTVVLYAGAPDDLAAVWVEPLGNQG